MLRCLGKSHGLMFSLKFDRASKARSSSDLRHAKALLRPSTASRDSCFCVVMEKTLMASRTLLSAYGRTRHLLKPGDCRKSLPPRKAQVQKPQSQSKGSPTSSCVRPFQPFMRVSSRWSLLTVFDSSIFVIWHCLNLSNAALPSIFPLHPFCSNSIGIRIPAIFS